uniref:BCL9L protein n=1 Tax=Anisakis simplex TaxID=6269 RepID=A0A0M3JHA2_ANISI
LPPSDNIASEPQSAATGMSELSGGLSNSETGCLSPRDGKQSGSSIGKVEMQRAASPNAGFMQNISEQQREQNLSMMNDGKQPDDVSGGDNKD